MNMNHFSVFKSPYMRGVFFLLCLAVGLLTLATSLRYSSFLDGIPKTEIRRIDADWYYQKGDSFYPVKQLPCQLDLSGNTMYLVHDLSDVEMYPDDVLVFQTRYQSIRIWADNTLIYQAAQGQEHALSSMWHFISAEKYEGASILRIELTKYDSQSDWNLFSVFLDHPDTIRMYLLQTYWPTLLVWLCCTLLGALLLLAASIMVIRKIEGIPLVLALAAFIFLSGMWILLDSKVTTVFGGNYSLTYFFSYSVFYLLPVPLLLYFQLLMKTGNRFLRYLTWITAGNAGLWMLLHLLGLISIRKTAVSVHLIIILFVLVFIREIYGKDRKQNRKYFVCTAWGIVLIFVVAVASIILYYVGLLPPTNSAVLYIWGLIALIVTMLMDTILMLDRMWKEKQYMEIYRQLATEDMMTRLYNRNAYELRLKDLAARPPEEVSFITFDIDQMKSINDTYGHHVGDQVIYLAAQCIYETFGSSGDCYRIGGDEFCVIETSSEEIPQKLRYFDQLVSERNQQPFPVRISHGWEKRTFGLGKTATMQDIINLKTASDEDLYRNKKLSRQVCS